MKNLTMKSLQLFLLIVGLAAVSFSCSDDETKLDCTKGAAAYEDLVSDYEAAAETCDLETMYDLHDDIIANVKKYKSCIVDSLPDGYTFEDYLADEEAWLDDTEASCAS